jgi:hypothetical protein
MRSVASKLTAGGNNGCAIVRAPGEERADTKDAVQQRVEDDIVGTANLHPI